ncbi:hypothetical protein [Piscirickettsia salmonis]|nr:hypothetical protein [Piscirickettsia salmonis]
MYESMEVDEEAPPVTGAETMLHWPLHYYSELLRRCEPWSAKHGVSRPR